MRGDEATTTTTATHAEMRENGKEIDDRCPRPSDYCGVTQQGLTKTHGPLVAPGLRLADRAQVQSMRC